jgi:hypothetical protein
VVTRALGKFSKRFSIIHFLACGAFEIMPFSARFEMLDQATEMNKFGRSPTRARIYKFSKTFVVWIDYFSIHT